MAKKKITKVSVKYTDLTGKGKNSPERKEYEKMKDESKRFHGNKRVEKVKKRAKGGGK